MLTLPLKYRSLSEKAELGYLKLNLFFVNLLMAIRLS